MSRKIIKGKGMQTSGVITFFGYLGKLVTNYGSHCSILIFLYTIVHSHVSKFEELLKVLFFTVPSFSIWQTIWTKKMQNISSIEIKISISHNMPTGCLKQFKFYFIFKAQDHIEYQPTYHNRWLKQKLKSFTWGLDNKSIFDFPYINYFLFNFPHIHYQTL